MSAKQIKKISLIVGLCACVVGVAVALKIPSSVPDTSKTVETPKVESTASTLASNRVYVMYVESCPMCKSALEYLDKNEADNPFIERVDLNTEKGRTLLKACRQKFGFKDVVIPLVCADKEYSMGWSGSVGEQIREWSKNAAAVY